MAPERPTWGLALRADALYGWAKTPRACGCNFWGVEGVYGPQSAPLFWQWWITTTSECFEGHKHPQQPQKLYLLAWGVSSIHSMRWGRAKGLMWGIRGPFLRAAAMVGYGCVGRCRQLDAKVRSTYCRNSNICLRKHFYFLCRSHIFLTSEPAAK